MTSLVARNIPSALGSRGATSLFVSATRRGGPAPGIVLDLDDTVLYRTRGLLDLLLLYANPIRHSALSVGVPYAVAPETIKELAQHYRIAAITARSGLAADHTARWLEKHGLSGMPLIHSARHHPGDHSRVAFKSNAIDFLKRKGGFEFQPLIGVGDRPSDIRTYRSQGMHALAVAHGNVSSVFAGGGAGSALQRGLEAVAEPRSKAGGGESADGGLFASLSATKQKLKTAAFQETVASSRQQGKGLNARNGPFATVAMQQRGQNSTKEFDDAAAPPLRPESCPSTLLFTDDEAAFAEASRLLPLTTSAQRSSPQSRGFLSPLALYAGGGPRRAVWEQIRAFLLEENGEEVLARMSARDLEARKKSAETKRWVEAAVKAGGSSDCDHDPAAAAAGNGGDGGGDHWEEEATAVWYVKDTPKELLRR